MAVSPQLVLTESLVLSATTGPSKYPTRFTLSATLVTLPLSVGR